MYKFFLIVCLLLPNLAFSQTIADETRYEYNRKLFGDWRDENRNCINTRNEVLIRDAITYSMDKTGCKVISGVWQDFYTGKILTDVSLIDIDHVVPLREMWDSGVSYYSRSILRKVYNDMDNLVVTHRTINRSKASLEPQEWRMFATLDNQCAFLYKWYQFKIKYFLYFDQKEYNFIINYSC